MARLFNPQPLTTGSPFKWTEDQRKRAHGLTVRATFAKPAPKIVKPAACPTCFTILAANGSCNCS